MRRTLWTTIGILAFAATVEAQGTFPFTVPSIPPEGLPYTATCDPPIGYRKPDGTIIPLDLSRLAYTLSVDRGERVPDTKVCIIAFILRTLGNHQIDVFARYVNDAGSIETSEPATATAILTLESSGPLLLLGPRNLIIVLGTPSSMPFVLDGDTWALQPDATGHRQIMRNGSVAPDAGPDCTLLIRTGTGMVAAFCPDGNWWGWVTNPTPPASHWNNLGPQTPRD
jgi:hypothetical protein